MHSDICFNINVSRLNLPNAMRPDQTYWSDIPSFKEGDDRG
jgi:hypothetical protein